MFSASTGGALVVNKDGFNFDDTDWKFAAMYLTISFTASNAWIGICNFNHQI
jgi:hypothetical protein